MKRQILIASMLFAISVTISAQYTKLYEFYGRELIESTRPVFDGTYLYGTAKSKIDWKDVIYRIKPDGTEFSRLSTQTFGSVRDHLILLNSYLYGYSTDGTIFRIKTDGTDYTVLKNIQVYSSGPITISDGVIYGTTDKYGAYNDGYIFKMNLDGTGFTDIYDFDIYTHERMDEPSGELCVSGNKIYGISRRYGYGYGALYSMNTDGTQVQVLYNFIHKQGAYPTGELRLKDNVLYGLTTYYKDPYETDPAAYFSINTDGTNYQQIHFLPQNSGYNSFIIDGDVIYGSDYSRSIVYSMGLDGNNFQELYLFNDAKGNGVYPWNGFTKVGSLLYGATAFGCTGNGGTLFSLDVNTLNLTLIADMNLLPPNGVFPSGKPLVSGSTLYGIAGGEYTINGSVSYQYTPASIYKMNTDGSGFAKIYDFSQDFSSLSSLPLSVGNSLTLANDKLYGMTYNGGANGTGCIFSLNTDGTMFTHMHDFSLDEAGEPYGSLLQLGNYLYGMTSVGGTMGAGTIFRIGLDGTGFQVIHKFDLTDGGYPHGSLISDGNMLYGTTSVGGNKNAGTIFKINPDGSNMTILYNFENTTESGAFATPTLQGSTLYGTTSVTVMDYSWPDPDADPIPIMVSAGCIYKINTDGSGFSHVYDFDNVTGANALGGVVVAGSNIYGITAKGGNTNNGVLYKYSLKTNTYSKLVDFTGDNGAINITQFPTYATFNSELTLQNNTLYAGTKYGGKYDLGVLFSYKLPTYHVIYDANGGVGNAPIDPSSYLEGTFAKALSNVSVSRKNSKFSGWNTAADGSGTAYNVNDQLELGATDITLYAQWIYSPTANITYNANGATGFAPEDINNYQTGSNATIRPQGNLQKTGYNFNGWNSAADGSGISYQAGGVMSITDNLTLYAQWQPVQSVLTYDANGGQGTLFDSNSPYAYNSVVTVLKPTNEITNAGYKIFEWNSSPDGTGTAYSFGQTFTMGISPVTLYAQWKPAYAVNYIANGALGSTPANADNQYFSGVSATIKDYGSLYKDGYLFNGWNTSYDGSGTNYSPGDLITIGNTNINLYAQWIFAPAFSVVYLANGGTGIPVNDVNSPYLYGWTVNVRDQGNLTKDGFKFDGWNTFADGSGVSYQPGETFTMGTTDVTLYAQWSAVTKIKNNTPDKSISVSYSNQKIQITNPQLFTGEVEISDLTGQVLIHRNSLESFSFNCSHGYYLVCIKTQGILIVKKIMVN